MVLTFYGATREVTGSCHFLQACGKNIMIDCGMYQGTDRYNAQQIPVTASDVDIVLLTHAHIDHTGLLPLLAKQKFSGKIYATKATSDLCDVMLKDSAHIQEFETEWLNRKGERAGKRPIEPLYTTKDAETAIKLFIPCEYDKEIDIAEGIKIRFKDIGHLLGSSSIEVFINENGEERKIVFSGDIGNPNHPLIKDPAHIEDADYVVIEATYGDRLHNIPPDYAANLAAIIQRTFDKGGNLIIPSFAVGRTQELLYFLRKIKENNMIKGHDGFPVYVDSPLANKATEIFKNNWLGCFDEEASELVRKGVNPIEFDDLYLSLTSDDSRAINNIKTPKIIISASGMCEAGRIRHHLKHNLWRPECTILFVGYQAEGTAGRTIVNGAKKITLFGELIDICAEVTSLEGFSGHADQSGLLRWLDGFSPKPKRVFVVHGEKDVCEIFSHMVKVRFDLPVSAPLYSEKYDLTANEIIRSGVKREQIEPSAKSSTAFHKLLSAGRRLQEIIELCANKPEMELRKFLDQVNSLIEKWR